VEKLPLLTISEVWKNCLLTTSEKSGKMSQNND
jgi:hypothetical protein